MKKILIGIASVVLFIELMDTTILYSCAVPVAKDFGVSSSKMSLPIISYIIGTCIFVPVIGWLANRFNRIHIIMISLLAFALSSILCGIAPGLYTFSILRFFQGIAISIGSAMTILTLLCHCSQDEIVGAMASINIPALFGTAIGPFVGALFAYYISWRVAFIINFPICVVMFAVLMPLKKQFNNHNTVSKVEFDTRGFFLMSVSLVLLALGFERLGHFMTLTNFLIVFLGIVFGITYVLIWRRRNNKNLLQINHSILDLHLFKNKDFFCGALVNLFARSSMCGIPLLMSIVLQHLYGYSIIKTGYYLAIISAAAIMAKFLSSYILKLGIHKSVILYAFSTGVSIFLLSFLDFWTMTGYLWAICFCFGFVMSLLYTSMNSLLYVSLNRDQIPNATNIATILQQFSIGLGVVLAVGGFNLLLSSHSVTIIPEYYYQIVNYYGLICKCLAFLMIFNLLVVFVLIYRVKNVLIQKKVVFDGFFT